jgi:plasmid stabilization system protein ParE
MNYQIHITGKAEQDLTQAADYIEFSLLNPEAADALLDKADTEISALSSMPQKHQLVDDPLLSTLGIRFILVNNYIAFYIIDEPKKTVHIVRFLYQKRDWLHILKNEPFRL